MWWQMCQPKVNLKFVFMPFLEGNMIKQKRKKRNVEEAEQNELKMQEKKRVLKIGEK